MKEILVGFGLILGMAIGGFTVIAVLGGLVIEVSERMRRFPRVRASIKWTLTTAVCLFAFALWIGLSYLVGSEFLNP